MGLTVLAVPGCPGAPVLLERLVAVLDGRGGGWVACQVISGAEEAVRRGMLGSPALLVDGADPFAEPGQAASLSCRLYRDEDGRPCGAPSEGQLRQAISQALPASAERDDDPAWPDQLGRAGRGRIAPAERGLRTVHQAVLRSFLHTGAAPGLADLAPHAVPFVLSQVLGELAEGDFLCLDPAGQITAAYPFSATGTGHRVRIAGAATAHAMCAIDALGMSAMTGRPVVIESADPATGQPVTVRVDQAAAVWDPDAAVVYAGRAGGGHAGPSAAVCCGYMNFFATPASAFTWAAAHPEIAGGIVSQARALEIGIAIFGQLLS